MPRIEKQALPIFFNEDGQPVGFIYFDPIRRARVIFSATEAGEDELIEFYEKKEKKL